MSDNEPPVGFAAKRQFLRALACTAGFALAGGARFVHAALPGTASYEVDPGIQYDIIVIGAGTAGIPLAIFAAGRGAKVLLIEKAGQIGGTLWISGGQMSAAGTLLQARKGIADNPDLFYQDVMRLSHGKTDAPVLRRYVDNAAPAIDWLEGLGLKVASDDPVKGKGHADFAIPRYLNPVGQGRALRGVMVPEIVKAEATGNLRVLMSTAVKELVQSGKGKRVSGVMVEDASGRRTRFNATSVVLASGGCMMSKDVFEKYTGRPLYALRAYPTSTGDGIVLGVNAGGHVGGADKFVAHRGAIVNDRNYPAKTFTTIGLQLNPQNRKPWEIEVNSHGRRYMAEDADIDTLERGQTNQPGMASWLIWDQEIYDRAPPLFARLSKADQQKAFESHPMFAKGDTIEAIAGKMNLPVDVVVDTVRRYNDGVAKGKDAFGRKHMPLPIAKGPYYAVECLGSAIYSQVGLDIDGDLRVTTRAGRPIPGLYAIGEVTGGWHTNGDVVINGGSVTPAVTFGRYLGMTLPISGK